MRGFDYIHFRIQVILILALLCFKFSNSQSYNFKNYSVENGLPYAQIYSIFQDKEGYLWSGGYGGLSKFDGKVFKNFAPRHGLADYWVTSICEGSEEKLYVGTINGLSIYQKNKFTTLKIENGLPANHINDLVLVEEKLFVATDSGLCIIIGNSIKKIKEFNKKSVTRLICKEGIVFCIEGGKVFQINNSTIKELKFKTEVEYVNCISIDSTNTLWCGTNTGVITHNLKTFVTLRYGVFNGLLEEKINAILCSANDIVWIGTENGLHKFNGRNFIYYPVGSDNGSNKITFLINDIESNLWIGTYAGLFKFRGEGLVTYGAHDGINNPVIFPISEDENNNLWIGTETDYLYKYANGIFYNYAANKGLSSKTVYTILNIDKKKLIGTANGVYIFENEKFISIPEFENKPCYSIFKDKNNRFWVGSINEAFSFSLKNDKVYDLTFYKVSGEIPNSQVWSFIEDNDGELWMSSYLSGLYKFEKNKFINQNDFYHINSRSCLTMAKDKRGNIFISTMEGVVLIDPNSSISDMFSEKDGLSSDLTYSILYEEKTNSIWAGTNQGINRINLTEYYENREKQIVSYNKPDGFKGVECNTNGIFEDSKGILWFGTVNGLIKYNPAEFFKNTRESKLNLTHIRLFYKDTTLVNGSILPYSFNNISFEFRGICLTNPDKVKYTYRLEGFDKTWSPESFDNEATYSNLPPGKYKFTVRSCNNEGLWNKDSVSFSFEITSPIWQRWWFIVISILFVVCLIILFFRWRLSSLQKQQEKDSMQQIEISKNELKALRSQMNPHFMFNSLNSIQHYIVNNKDNEAVFYLNKFAKLMRMILNNSEKPTVTVKEEIDALRLYLELEQMRFEKKFHYEIIVDDTIDQDYEELPTMLIQPYLENAILHGLTPKKDGIGKLTLEVKNIGGILLCSVIDNGIGRVASSEIKSKRAKEHKSLGLKITQDRLKLLNTINQSNLSVKINDLYTADGLAVGTRVDIYIPIQ